MPINEIGTIYTPSIYGRKSFPLNHKGDPIFYKIFNSQSSSVVNVSSDIINIPNHFFRTGEPLKYNSGAGSSIGISTTSPGALGITSQFSSTVYPIVVDKDNIRISLGSSYAASNQYVDITSLGIGTQHSFEAFKQNSKCLITLNNIIQSPISVGSTTNVISYTENSLFVNSLQNIKIGTCLRINNEIVRVASINYDTKEIKLSRGTDVLGTDVITFSSSLIGGYVDVLSGNYNIIKNTIYFDDPPLEGKKIIYKILTPDINYSNYSFNLFTDILTTGSQVLLSWTNPPTEIPQQKYYFVIKNSNNNFSFAETFFNAIQGTKVSFGNISNNEFAVSDFQLVFFYPNIDSTFNGRVFLKSNYDGNLVFDDISEQFTGITSSFELKSSGISTVGIKSDNGILLVNNIFQYPGFDEAFSFVESASKTYANFVGFGTTGFTGKSYDINVKDYPRGGIIVSYGTTSGSNYTPLSAYSNLPLTGSAAGIGASVSFNIDLYGNVKDFKFANFGYNYKVGEILVPSGTTGVGSQTTNDKIHITINDTTKDSFNAWNIGILDKLDDLSDKANGVRKTFSLTKDGQRISLDTESQYEIELQYNLLVFVNDVLQIPNSSYTFNGGSIITFTESIPTGSNVKIYIYKGYYNDTFIGTSVSKIKEGDLVQLAQDIYGIPPVEENARIIKQFISADVLRTDVYSDIGLSEDSSQLRSITWTPQKTDLILDGVYLSKSRPEQNSGIGTFTIITQNVTVGIGTTVGITTTLGTYIGFATNTIGINTTVGIGSLISIGDYVESSFTGLGVSIVSIGTSSIGIRTTSSQNISGITTYSPTGITTTSISFYRKL